MPHESPALPLTDEAPGPSEPPTETAGPDVAPPADSTTMVFRPAPEPEPISLAEPELEPITVTEAAPPEPEPEPEPELPDTQVPLAEPVVQAGRPTEPLAVHHIGIAVSSIDQAMQFYGEKLGLSVVSRVAMPERSLKVAFVRTGNTLIELLEPTSDSSTVARFIERRGPGLHHLCFGTPDIAEHLRDLKDKGVELIDDTPRPGGLGSVAFVQPAAAHGVLIELLQERLPDAEAPY